MAGLTISLLGPPRVEVEGVPIAVDTRKAIALLAHLAVTGRRQSRDVLAAMLWPDRDGAHAMGALRRTLSVLSRALGGRHLEIERASVALDPADLWLDVAAFRDHVAAGRDREAIELYRGDFLSGFALRDGVAFEDWQLLEADVLRRGYATALERLARVEAQAGRLAEAIELARRWLALDELQELAHRLLIELYARGGERLAALEQYRHCVRTLDRELGVAPLEATAALYGEILADTYAPSRAPLAWPPAPGSAAVPRPGSHPLVGRERERSLLGEALDAAARDGRLAVLEGEAGIGKTRLLDDLAERARAEGHAVARTRCSQAEKALAYATVADLLRDALAGSGGADWVERLPGHARLEASRLVAELSGDARPLPPDEGPGARARFLEGVWQALAASARLLLIDDAHWIDEASLSVLAYAARRLRGRPVCIVLAWRSEEVAAEHPLRRLAADVAPVGSASVLVLPRLEAAGVAELAAAAGRPELAEQLFEETGGLPLFAVEYLAASRESRERRELPPGVSGLLLGRVAAAGETARQVLAAASVLGRAFSAELVHEVSGRGEEEVVAALEELVRRGLLLESADGYDFDHDRVRELVYGSTSLARRRLLHARAARAIAPADRRDPGSLAALVAEHYRLAGREGEAAAFAALAGDRAFGLHARADARGHFEEALALGHPEAARLHEALGDLDVLEGRYDAALARFEAAAALAANEALAELERKLGVVHERRGDYEQAAVRLQLAARSGAERGPAWAAGLEVDRALVEHRRGAAADALRHATTALSLAEQSQDAAALARAENVLAVLAAAAGDGEEARRRLAASLALAELLADPEPRIAALNNLALVARARGDAEEAVSFGLRALEACTAHGDRHRAAAIHGNLADTYRDLGREAEAMEQLKAAVAILAEIGGSLDDPRPEVWKLVEW